jgi:hypothetical protein
VAGLSKNRPKNYEVLCADPKKCRLVHWPCAGHVSQNSVQHGRQEIPEFDAEMKKAEAMPAQVNNCGRLQRAQFGLKRCPSAQKQRILSINDILRFFIKRPQAYLSFYGSNLPFLPLGLSAFALVLEPIHAYVLALQPDTCAATAVFTLLLQVLLLSISV